jgi:hypothetical protein
MKSKFGKSRKRRRKKDRHNLITRERHEGYLQTKLNFLLAESSKICEHFKVCAGIRFNFLPVPNPVFTLRVSSK